MNPIPKQIINGNICPIKPKGKGNWHIPKDKVLAIAEHLSINPNSISQEAWSEKDGKFFVSWKGFNKLPKKIQERIKNLEFKKSSGYGIKTGKQQDGKFIIVFDCDNDKNRAFEYMNFLRKVYGDTFIRETPSKGFHLFYESPNGGIIKKKNMHIDLRHYLSHDGLKDDNGNYNNVFDIEIKQGSFIKEDGISKDGNYSTYRDKPIKKLNSEIDLLELIQKSYPNSIQIKEFIENGTSTPYNNKESLKVLDSELLDILNTQYLPSYISTTLKGHRDNLIIPATFGFLIKRNMPRKQMEAVLDWINNIAENKKEGNPDKRNYNFDNIPDILSGSGRLRKHGFDKFVDTINSLDPEYKTPQQKDLEIEIKKLKKLGYETLKSFDGDASNRLIAVFDKLHPGNGTNIFLGWLACLSSVKGNPLIVIVKGDPGTGKTQITDIIKDSIHSRHIIKLNNATESSLFGRGNIDGENYPDKKIFYLGDLGDKNAMTNTAPYRKHIRELLSDGETTRELSDTNKEKDKHREVLSETLTGYPTMIYSTVRDGEIEQQETDRAIELYPDLSKIQRIKRIIIYSEDPTANITKKITALKSEWYPKFQGIVEYLIDYPPKVLLPWDLTNEKYGLRDTKTIASITRKIAMVNQHSRDKIEEYIIASPFDLLLALRYVQDGGLERTRLQQIYDKYTTLKCFTRDDVASMFPDSYSGGEGGKRAFRSILKAGLEERYLKCSNPECSYITDYESIEKENNPKEVVCPECFKKLEIEILIEETTDQRPYLYKFKCEPGSYKARFKMPEKDYTILEKEYPNLPWIKFHKSNTNI